MKFNKPILSALLLSIGTMASAYSQEIGSGVAMRQSEQSDQPAQIDFTYYQGGDVDFTGYDGQKRQSAAIAIDPVAIKGMKITSIYAVGFQNTSEFGNLRFWGSTVLSHDHNMIDLDAAPIVDGTAEKILEKEIIVPDTPFYIGYDIDVYADYGSFIPFSKGATIPGTAYITYGAYGFSDFSGFMGPLTIGMTLEAEEPFAENSVLLADYGASVMVRPGDPINVRVKAFNNGIAPVDKFAYIYEIDGSSHRMDVELPKAIEPNLALSTPVDLSLDPIMEEGQYSISISAIEVNGVENPSKTSTAIAEVIVALPPDVSVLDGTTPFAYTSEPPNSWYFAGGKKCTYDVGMKIKSPEFVGMEVVGARVTGLTRTNGVGNFKGWLTSALGDTFDIETINTGNPDETGELLIIFKEPYKLSEDGAYIGYSCDVIEVTDESMHCIPLYISYEEGKFTNGCIINAGYGWSDEGYWNGCATTITAYLRGELPSDNISLGNMRSHSIVEKDKPYTLTFEVTNNGGNDVESIEYSYTVAGEEKTQTLTFPEPVKPGIGIISLVDIEFAGIAEAGSYPLKVTVNKVNSNPNSATKPSTECNISVIDYKVPHRVLMEEATGTWCGYCPRGWLAMREMTELYPDFIGIAYHDGDPMTVGGIPFDNAGFPYASLDRSLNTDPFFGTAKDGSFGIENDWLAMRNQLTVADIDLTAEWNDDKSNLNVTSYVRFALPIENANYQVGYVLVGNGYSNQSKMSWMQKNYYSGESQTGLLEELTKLPSIIPNMVYDDVAICSEYSYGIENSLPSSVAIGETYTHTQTFDTSSIIGKEGDELILNKDNLEVVAFIISPEGRIVNSNKIKPGSSAVDEIEDNSTILEETYYTLDGIRVSNPVQGLYVVKTLMNDGTVKVKKVCLP